jgi:hypothetical protein
MKKNTSILNLSLDRYSPATSFVPVSPNKTRAYSTDADDTNKIKPAVVYANADTQKKQILLENKGRSGVYY